MTPRSRVDPAALRRIVDAAFRLLRASSGRLDSARFSDAQAELFRALQDLPPGDPARPGPTWKW